MMDSPRSRSYPSSTIFGFSLAVAFLLQCDSALAFSVGFPRATSTRNGLSPFLEQRMTSSQHTMCICIDCSRVTNCKAYHFVETKHSQPHMTEDPVSQLVPNIN